MKKDKDRQFMMNVYIPNNMASLIKQTTNDKKTNISLETLILLSFHIKLSQVK